jgi:hypothetical protein
MARPSSHTGWSARAFAFLSTGHLHRLDTLMVFIAAVAHVILFVACVAAFRQLHPRKKQWRQFLAGGFLVLTYFALIVVALRPH